MSAGMQLRVAEFLGLRPETVQQWQKDYELGTTRKSRALLQKARGESFSVSSNDICRWSATIDARYSLPKLIRLLAHSDCKASIDFPAMEDAQASGWDGLVQNDDKNGRFVPRGTSVWELSTESRPQVKAERDYRKRTQAPPLNLDPAQTTFVLATSRKWPNKKTWAAEKTREKLWKKVVVYDASDLEQWLELTPSISVWFASHIGHPTTGIQSLEAFWKDFSVYTAPPMTPSVLIAGREAVVEKLAAWCTSGSGVLRVLADSADEALAFMAATMLTKDSSHILIRNTVVVEDAEEVRQLLQTTDTLTFAWRLDDPSLLGIVIDRNHRVLVPVSRSASSTESADIELTRLGRQAFIDALALTLPDSSKDKSLAKAEAERRSRLSGRSMTVYRRLYPASKVPQRPKWASSEHAHELLPLLLVGAWNESNEADQCALATLADRSYHEISALLAKYKNQADCPLKLLGGTWKLVSPLDAWSLLSSYVTESWFARYRKVVLEVLGEPDPSLELTPDDRWLSQLRGKQFRHSDTLRKGLAESLIFLVVFADRIQLVQFSSSSDRVSEAVLELLGRENDKRGWASLYDQLPALAEAAPEVFLRVLEDSLASKNPDIMSLFEAEKRPLGATARHPHLLWALELLAWYPEYLHRASKALGKLASLDPGGNLANRPLRSLQAIFCCWHPNTAASLTDRVNAIDCLLQREPVIAWHLLLELLPKTYDTGHNNAEPRWRAMPDRGSVTWGDAWEAYNAIIERAMRHAGSDPDRLCDLIDKVVTWSPEQRNLFVQQLRSFSTSCDDRDQRTAVWTKLRNFIGFGRSYGSLANEQIALFEPLLETLAPVDPIESHRWLFDEDFLQLTNPKRVSGGTADQDAQTMVDLDSERERVVALIMRTLGSEALLALAAKARRPHLVGKALAQVADSQDQRLESDLVYRMLSADNENHRRMGLAYCWTKRERQGDVWCQEFIQSSDFSHWSPSVQAAFCLTLPEGRQTWQFVSQLDLEAEDRYWKEVFVSLIRIETNEEADFALTRLVAVGRELDALDQAGFAPERISVQVLFAILDGTARALAREDGSKHHLINYNIERIYHRLKDSNDVAAVDLGRIELQFLPVLENMSLTLHKTLQRDAEFFAQLVAQAFQKDEEQALDTEETAGEDEVTASKRAQLAWSILSKWRDVPGQDDDGTLDFESLSKWVSTARHATATIGRLKVGDSQIGRVLAFAPNGADGIWPHEAVRNLLENVESRSMEGGLISGCFNKRGVWCKSPADGGRPEREIAKRYRTEALILSRWPRTAEVLNSLARTYEQFGRIDDYTAEALDLVP